MKKNSKRPNTLFQAIPQGHPIPAIVINPAPKAAELSEEQKKEIEEALSDTSSSSSSAEPWWIYDQPEKGSKEWEAFERENEENRVLIKLYFEYLENTFFSKQTQPPGQPTLFSSTAKSTIPLYEYYYRFIPAFKLSHFDGILALNLLFRIKACHPNFEVDAFNIYRLLCVAMGTIHKYGSDARWIDNSKHFAIVGGLNLSNGYSVTKQYNALEVEFLALLNFDFYWPLKPENYQRTKDQFKNLPYIKNALDKLEQEKNVKMSINEEKTSIQANLDPTSSTNASPQLFKPVVTQASQQSHKPQAPQKPVAMEIDPTSSGPSLS